MHVMFFTERLSERWAPDKKPHAQTALICSQREQKKKRKKEKGRTGYTADIGGRLTPRANAGSDFVQGSNSVAPLLVPSSDGVGVL